MIDKLENEILFELDHKKTKDLSLGELIYLLINLKPLYESKLFHENNNQKSRKKQESIEALLQIPYNKNLWQIYEVKKCEIISEIGKREIEYQAYPPSQELPLALRK